ncbi:MAG: NIPSNAP family protein, partial [Cyclobacteriaceae bacterium]|nr:NIPSNAP family protein [Cyclobacteriaceae bacterium]
TIHSKINSDKKYLKSGADYLNTSKENAAYARIKSSLLVNFVAMPKYDIPDTKAPKSERVYELRSYQSYSEQKGLSKIHMFNEGGETAIFSRLGFNAVFYSQALIGHERPNLVYMTTFDNMDDRNKHWDAFRTDPAWDKLKVLEEYKDTVSKNNTNLLRPLDFSQI